MAKSHRSHKLALSELLPFEPIGSKGNLAITVKREKQMYCWLMSVRTVFQCVGFAAFVVCMLSGCGGGGGYDVSGNVTFKGQPIPEGKIYFTPDSSKGNSGSPGYATIKQGKYDTADSDGKPTPGGAMSVMIEGWDPSAASQQDPGDTSGEKTVAALFPVYRTTAELAKAKATQDFDVPAEAADRKDQPEVPRNIGP